MKKNKECFRQVIHLLYWIMLVFLHSKWVINSDTLLFLIIIWVIFLIIIKIKPKAYLIWKLTKVLERESDYRVFPWKWLFFYTLWSFSSLYFFQENIAYASILILWTWDAFSNIIWRKLWKNHWKFNKKKTIEWSIWWFIPSLIASVFFVKLIPAIIASFVAMIIEAIDLKIAWIKIDDNLTIPIISWAILSFCCN